MAFGQPFLACATHSSSVLMLLALASHDPFAWALQQSGFVQTNVTPQQPEPVVPGWMGGGGGPAMVIVAFRKDLGPEPSAFASMLIAPIRHGSTAEIQIAEEVTQKWRCLQYLALGWPVFQSKQDTPGSLSGHVPPISWSADGAPR